MNKKSSWLAFTLALAGLILLVACGGTTPTGEQQTPEAATADTAAGTSEGTAVQPIQDAGEGDIVTMYVGPELVDCTGVAPQQCMQVKQDPSAEYTLFYGQIEGFTFEPGYEYELQVRVENVENPPADGSSLKYTLIEVVSQTPVSGTVAPAEAGEATALADTMWQLQSLQGAEVAAGTEITAVFGADGTLSGSSGCNNYSTSYTVDGSTLTINAAIAATMMACDEPVMQQETGYLAVLPTATSWVIDGNSLTLSDASGAAVAVYTAVTSPSLAGTTWQLNSFNNGLGGVTSLIAGTQITAMFGADGTLSGNAGCNNYNTSYTLDGSNITIDPAIATTRMACASDVAEQETAYLAALPNAATYTIQGDTLELRHATGSLIASYTAVAADSGSSSGASLTGTTWQLTSFNNGLGGVASLLSGTEITAVFGEDGTLSGNAGCNSYSTSYTLEGDAITINPAIAVTSMACADQAVMEQEAAYLAALPNAATYTIQGDTLELHHVTGSLIASYTAVAAAPLAGTTWQLTGYNNGQGGVVSVNPNTQVTAVFGEDGTLSGNAGCNSYSTSYTIEGSTLSINSAIASTMMACAEDVMQQETAFLAALPNATTFNVQGDSLELRDSNGALIASFTAASATGAAGGAAGLVGTTWGVTTYNNGNQAAVGVIDGTQITMIFGEDGNVQGSASCNQFFGPYTMNGESLTVGPLATTRAYCPDPQGIMDQETRFLTALQTAVSYTIQNGGLDMRTANGEIAVMATSATQ